MRFQIPQALAPGVPRRGYGFMKPGVVFEAREDTQLHPRLIPLDKEAAVALFKAYPKHFDAPPPVKGVLTKEPEEEVVVTPRDLAGKLSEGSLDGKTAAKKLGK